MRPDDEPGSPWAGLTAMALSLLPLVVAFVVWLVVPLHQLPGFVFSVPSAVLSIAVLAVGIAAVVVALSRPRNRWLGVAAALAFVASVAVVGVFVLVIVVGGALGPTN